jgi:hypothetical protein
MSLSHHAAHLLGVGQVGLNDDVPGAGQAGQHAGGLSRGLAMVDRHPVAAVRECLGDRPPDAA